MNYGGATLGCCVSSRRKKVTVGETGKEGGSVDKERGPAERRLVRGGLAGWQATKGSLKVGSGSDS